MSEHNDQRPYDISNCHERHDYLRYSGYSPESSDYNKTCYNTYKYFIASADLLIEAFLPPL